MVLKTKKKSIEYFLFTPYHHHIPDLPSGGPTLSIVDVFASTVVDVLLLILVELLLVIVVVTDIVVVTVE